MFSAATMRLAFVLALIVFAVFAANMLSSVEPSRLGAGSDRATLFNSASAGEPVPEQ